MCTGASCAGIAAHEVVLGAELLAGGCCCRTPVIVVRFDGLLSMIARDTGVPGDNAVALGSAPVLSVWHGRRYPGSDPKYAALAAADIPVAESLKLVVDRFMPLWLEEVASTVKSGKKVLICAHGNSIRALCKFLDDIRTLRAEAGPVCRS